MGQPGAVLVNSLTPNVLGRPNTLGVGLIGVDNREYIVSLLYRGYRFQLDEVIRRVSVCSVMVAAIVFFNVALKCPSFILETVVFML